MPKKSKKLIKATGKVEDVKSTKKSFNNIYQILGDNGLQKYGTLDPKVYSSNLEKLSDNDLRIEAEKYGLKHIHSKEITIKNLMEEFYKYTYTFSENYGKTIVPKNIEAKSEKLKEILRAAK